MKNKIEVYFLYEDEIVKLTLKILFQIDKSFGVLSVA